jgi:hypothetical protein
VNSYHAQTLQVIGHLLGTDDLAWLKQVTTPIG